MKYTQTPETMYEQVQLNAGIVLHNFDPETGIIDRADIVGATTGGITFTATPTFSDFAADIDNAPTNMKELKRLDTWDVSMSGTFVTIDTASARSLISAADISGNVVAPRNDLLDTDFTDIWWVGDYSNKNDKETGGFLAIHMKNALSTGGFSVKSNKNGKGNFAFTYTAHYSIVDPDEVPFKVYIQQGGETP